MGIAPPGRPCPFVGRVREQGRQQVTQGEGGKQAMDRQAEAQGWGLVRRALRQPEAEASMSPDRLRRELDRLQTRLARVQSRGGPYGEVSLSPDVRSLLARLDAGATLSALVH